MLDPTCLISPGLVSVRNLKGSSPLVGRGGSSRELVQMENHVQQKCEVLKQAGAPSRGDCKFCKTATSASLSHTLVGTPNPRELFQHMPMPILNNRSMWPSSSPCMAKKTCRSRFSILWPCRARQRTSPRPGTRASPGAPGPCHISTGEPGPDRYRNTSPGASSGLKRLC